ncbi:MAG TPA: 1-acyl-sn-glycerol-3-phosphate acyltransferase [Sphaerochaeta sp.]|nr:1-acyl-sn-glycerol-3-phosphate acyltransferase [Sphaerochaeta sp.]
MDLNAYKDISPYRGSDVQEAIGRVVADKSAFLKILAGFLPTDTAEQRAKNEQYAAHMMGVLHSVRSYNDFQKKLSVDFFLPAVLQKSVDDFSFSGLENIAKDKAYLFISNHRDIVLDFALINYVLIKGEKTNCEMAVGDNLLTNQYITDIFKLNGGVTVKRTLPMREKYLESIRLSNYFVELITEDKTSIWVAQKSGRAKDGLDVTTPAIIKMLHLSQKRKGGVSFSDVINRCNIVPISISYEYDPCDIIKSVEEVGRLRRGEQPKKKYEDLISISRGLKGYKGRIHIAYGEPLTGEFANSDEVASAIDRQIHLSYKLWPTNCFAYDYLEHTDTFKDEYASFDTEAFLDRFKNQKEDVRLFALNSYANPVRSFLKAQAQ